ncbi:unnamed protein product (mitochondrion) [Plasmodiophora brassicae]|uniref:Uncharacterized protein n=1 Tax=Plasmodiophora brassicae TaxID=37360 RepID=A0A0G4IIB0_PLABS|nr:hypothetical protein PBRA_003784 [Plasmodiophora brassicae]SPQ94302.1 unnamed protein product [Plasmodiophora brassicae]
MVGGNVIRRSPRHRHNQSGGAQDLLGQWEKQHGCNAPDFLKLIPDTFLLQCPMSKFELVMPRDAAVSLYRFLHPAVDTEGHRRGMEAAASNTSRHPFNTPFVDPGGRLVSAFTQHVQHVVHQWRQHHLFAPYFAVCQSAGYGKSRLIKAADTSSHLLHTIYICLRDPNLPGYPHVNQPVRQFLAGLQSSRNAARDLTKWLHCLLSSFWKSGGQHDWPAVQNMSTKVAEFFASACRLDDNQSTFPNVPADNVIAIVFDHASLLNQITAVDERGDCITLFRLLRRVLRSLPGGNLVAILVDAAWEEQDFAGPMDPDGHLDPAGPRQIAEPFTALATRDLLRSRWRHLSPYVDLFTSGRPFWTTLLHDGSEVALDTLKREALLTLLAGHNQPVSESDLVAMFSAVMPVKVNPQSSLAMDLVQSHLATLLAVCAPFQGRACTVIYPPEPILAEATLSYIAGNLPKALSEGAIALRRLMAQGVLECDRRRAFVMSIVLIASRAVSARQSKFISEPVRCRCWLSELFGDAAVNKVAGGDFGRRLSSSLVSFTHIVEVDNDDALLTNPLERLLPWMFARRIAVRVPVGKTTTQFLISVMVPPENDAQAATFTFVVVSVADERGSVDVPAMFGSCSSPVRSPDATTPRRARSAFTQGSTGPAVPDVQPFFTIRCDLSSAVVRKVAVFVEPMSPATRKRTLEQVSRPFTLEALGLSPSVFPFMTDDNRAHLQDLLRPVSPVDALPAHQRQLGQLLRGVPANVS